MTRLHKGDRFKMPDGTLHEVLSVDPCSALVRPIKRKYESFQTRSGEQVNFDKPSGAFRISSNSLVEIIEDD